MCIRTQINKTTELYQCLLLWKGWCWSTGNYQRTQQKKKNTNSTKIGEYPIYILLGLKESDREREIHCKTDCICSIIHGTTCLHCRKIFKRHKPSLILGTIFPLELCYFAFFLIWKEFIYFKLFTTAAEQNREKQQMQWISPLQLQGITRNIPIFRCKQKE